MEGQTIDPVEILSDWKTYFWSIYNFSVQTNVWARFRLCSDLKPFVKGQVDGQVYIEQTFGEVVIVIPNLRMACH
jgi:hypothetical protein